MATSVNNPTTKRYAVVTGANKGIGLGICKQLAADHGFTIWNIVQVNNAGIGGIAVDEKGFLAQASKIDKVAGIKWAEISTESYELTEQCVQTNYYGAKRMTEALIPLLQLSDSPRIANVSSSMGKLKV
ncbi:hypothetical protein POM88_039993 [Heracleum sosnowskyi]|uniref:Carbonyl reductase n=1 Tax=Heracleum sosnowskyi TaxID=360622 RepID=A0AAD8HB52_9APIA|nr:hypothetical protein POM88_039993 [Heracleum sosnowskyi]